MSFKFLAAFVLGAVLMVLLSFTIYRQSYFYKKARAEARGLEEKPGMGSRLVTVAIALAMVLFFVLFDLWLPPPASNPFVTFSALNLLLAALLSLFDALFIDYFLLLVWRPALLRLPEGQPTRPAMMRHIRAQFTRGWVFVALIALPAAALATLLG